MQDQMTQEVKTTINKVAVLPAIPDKQFFTIGEVSYLCTVKPYVLRYWEQEFPQLAPNKRRGRRYYQHKDVMLVRSIRRLLYDYGFTIEGARQQLTGERTQTKQTQADEYSVAIKDIIKDLKIVLTTLQEGDRI